MLSAAIQSASSGLQVQAERLAVSAANTANQSTDGYRASRVVPAAVPGGGVVATVQETGARSPIAERDGGLVELSNTDPIQEAVVRAEAVVSYKANLAVIRAADDATRHLLDTLA